MQERAWATGTDETRSTNEWSCPESGRAKLDENAGQSRRGTNSWEPEVPAELPLGTHIHRHSAQACRSSRGRSRSRFSSPALFQLQRLSLGPHSWDRKLQIKVEVVVRCTLSARRCQRLSCCSAASLPPLCRCAEWCLMPGPICHRPPYTTRHQPSASAGSPLPAPYRGCCIMLPCICLFIFRPCGCVFVCPACLNLAFFWIMLLHAFAVLVFICLPRQLSPATTSFPPLRHRLAKNAVTFYVQPFRPLFTHLPPLLPQKEFS